MHAFDPAAYKKHRLPYLFVMMLPSFIIDAVLLYRIVTRHPAVLTGTGALDIIGVIMLFAVNAALLKSYAFIIYFGLKALRAKSHILVHEDRVVFHKRRLVMSAEAYNYAYFINYEIRAIDRLRIRKSGAAVLRGDFPAVFLCEDETLHHKGTRCRVVLPPYYSDMTKLLDSLNVSAK